MVADKTTASIEQRSRPPVLNQSGHHGSDGRRRVNGQMPAGRRRRAIRLRAEFAVGSSPSQ
jgi:hypothetical protein